MNIFNLPDLGEGLPDAEIHEWFVKEGEQVGVDTPLVSMETAKAVVDVPSPQSGIIVKCYGKPGDIIKTGEPLVAFAGSTENNDKGTVVGKLEELKSSREDHFTIGTKIKRIKVTPAVRLLAKKLNVDLTTLEGTGEHGLITKADVEAKGASPIAEGFEALHGVRRAMFTQMVASHKEVVPVTIFDEVDIHGWDAKRDITLKLIHAMIAAVKVEPALNAWFDGKSGSRKVMNEVHLGLAMDSQEGLFVPVIHDAGQHDDKALRQIIDEYKKAVSARTIAPDALKNPTITLSNFGKFAGRFASPIIVPPMVAILAAGRLFEAVVNVKGKMESHRMLPLSLTFDHRAVTGGEATRFLGAVMQALM